MASITISAAGPSTHRREEIERGRESERRKKRKELRRKTRNCHQTSLSYHKVTKLKAVINAMSSNIHILTHSIVIFSPFT